MPKAKSKKQGTGTGDFQLQEMGCSCGNVCNRMGIRRGACPCLTAEKFCSDKCVCGVPRMGCTNKPGHPESILCSKMGIPTESMAMFDEYGYGSESEDEDPKQPRRVTVLFDEKDGPFVVEVPEDVSKDASLQELATDVLNASRSERPGEDGSESTTEGHPPAAVAHAAHSPPTLDIDSTTSMQPGQTLAGVAAHSSPPHGSPPPQPDAPDWCRCGHCREMPQVRERVCCTERMGHPCITVDREQELREIVLHRGVLVVALNVRNDLFVYRAEPTTHNLRYIAYRQYVAWRYGYLGKGNRVVIPSCVTWLIRDTYPAPDGVYVGFLEGRVD